MGLNQRSKSLIERAAPGLEPTAHDRERARARIAERLALAAVAGAAASAVKPAAGIVKGASFGVSGVSGVSAAAPASFGLAKLIVVSALGIGAVGGAAYAVVDRSSGHDLPPPARVVEVARPPAATIDPANAPRLEAPASAIEAAPAKTPDVVAEAETSPNAIAPAVGARAPASSPARDLSEENRLIKSALTAGSRGDHEAARQALAEHERRFPDGQLAENRATAQVVELCREGRVDEARAAGAAFLAAHPDSMFADRVRTSCAGKK